MDCHRCLVTECSARTMTRNSQSDNHDYRKYHTEMLFSEFPKLYVPPFLLTDPNLMRELETAYPKSQCHSFVTFWREVYFWYQTHHPVSHPPRDPVGWIPVFAPCPFVLVLPCLTYSECTTLHLHTSPHPPEYYSLPFCPSQRLAR